MREEIRIEPESLNRISQIPGVQFDSSPRDGIYVCIGEQVGLESKGDTILFDGENYEIVGARRSAAT